jgi:hypothetical protein
MWAELGRRAPFGRRFFLKAFGRGVSGWEYIIIRQKNCSMGESGKHLGMRDDVY